MPVFYLLKSEIARIIYKNGETQSYHASFGPVDNESPTTTMIYSTPRWHSRAFTDDLSSYNSVELKRVLDFYKTKAKVGKFMAMAFGATGSVAAIAGAVLLIKGKKSSDGYGQDDSKREMGVGLLTSGLGAGVSVGLIGGLSFKKYKRKALLVEKELMNREVSLNQLKIRPSYNPFSKNASLSIALQF